MHQTSLPPDERTPPAVRVGTAVGAGAIASLACVLPSALRVAAGGGVGVVASWSSLAASALGPMIVSVLVLRGARDGLRAFAGEGASLRAFGVALWFSLVCVGLSIFGSVLRATTHHHALAGVTYAFGALFLAGGGAVVCARVVSIARGLPARGRRAFVGALAFAVGILMFAVAVRFVRASAHDAASHTAAATVIDVLAFVLAAVFGARPALASRRWLAIAGAPLALAVVVLGMLSLRDKATFDAVTQQAPAFAPFADVFSSH